jgi:hypothetical protein
VDLEKRRFGKGTSKDFHKSPCAIADGHHRYETSLAYSQWARKALKNGAPASDRVLAYFSSSDDAGLEVLPTHRAVPWEKRKFVNLEKWGTLKPVRGLSALKKLMDGKKGPGLLEVGVYGKGNIISTPSPKFLRNLRTRPTRI